VDTRSKIQTSRPTGPEWVTVTGYFDPLVAGHAARLRGLAEPGRKLLVIVADPPEPILEARARAELVAALACVDAVSMEAQPGPGATHDLRSADLEDRARLIAHIRARLAANG
jgi:glycerol-3-phosphate cytidylyltransferase-like family protein